MNTSNDAHILRKHVTIHTYGANSNGIQPI